MSIEKIIFFNKSGTKTEIASIDANKFQQQKLQNAIVQYILYLQLLLNCLKFNSHTKQIDLAIKQH